MARYSAHRWANRFTAVLAARCPRRRFASAHASAVTAWRASCLTGFSHAPRISLFHFDTGVWRLGALKRCWLSFRSARSRFVQRRHAVTGSGYGHASEEIVSSYCGPSSAGWHQPCANSSLRVTARSSTICAVRGRPPLAGWAHA